MNTLDPAPADCLASTEFLDYDAPAVAQFARAHSDPAADDIENAKSLYYAVRDSIRYDPYRVDLTREGFRASHTLRTGAGFCLNKAGLLAASARSIGIPARLGFGDVKNHLTTDRLNDIIAGGVFVFHGYTELWLEGRWVKATPAFNLSMCKKFGVLPLEFNGRDDSIFHPATADGRQHMEYTRDRGVRNDIPYDEVIATWRADYGAPFFDFMAANIAASFEADDARERKA